MAGTLVFLPVIGCLSSLDTSKIACQVGDPESCPEGLECRPVAGGGRCCRLGDDTCGARDAALDFAGSDAPADTRLEVDASGAREVASESGGREDAPADVPLGEVAGTGGRDGGIRTDVQVDASDASGQDGGDVPLGGGGGAGGMGGAGGTGAVAGSGGIIGTGGGGLAGAGGASIVGAGGANGGAGGISAGAGGVTVGAGGSTAGGTTGSGGIAGTGGVTASGGISGSGGLGTGGATGAGGTGTGGTGTGGTGTGGTGTGGTIGSGGTGVGGTTGGTGGATGTCPTTCALGQHCVGGSCVCDATSCTGCCDGTTCRYLENQDESKCGIAGATCSPCPSNSICKNARCEACATGETRCGNTCVCGACGVVCSPGQRCSGGTCICDADSCQFGCCDENNSCVGYDAQDLSKCGLSGVSCKACSITPSPTCTNGTCSATIAVIPTESYVWAMAVGNGYVYWGNGRGEIQKVPVGGGPTSLLYAPDSGAPNEWVLGMAVDANYVYWGLVTVGNPVGAIVKVPINGGPAVRLASGGGQNVGWPYGIAIDGTNVYFTDDGGVMRVPIGSTGTAAELFDSDRGGERIAADGANVYWTNSGKGKVMKKAVGGGTAIELASSQDSPKSIAVDANNVYWANYGTSAGGSVMKVPIGGGSPTAVASDLGANTKFVAVDSANVYWTNGGGVGKAPVGGGPTTWLAFGRNSAAWLSLDATSVYWAESGAIVRAPK